MDFEGSQRTFTEEQLINPAPGKPDQIVAALNHDVKSSEWILAALHRQWYEQIFWTLGEQYMEWNQRTRRFQVRPSRTYIPRSITNLILPKVEIGVSVFLDSLPRPKVISKTKEDKDRAAAEVANGILRYKDDEIMMSRKKRETGVWTVTTGTCYNEVLLDEADKETLRIPKYEDTQEPVTDGQGNPIRGPGGAPVMQMTEQPVMNPETGAQAFDEVVLADENVEVRSPFEIIPDWAARYPWEFRRYTHFRAQTRDWIGRVFGAEAKKKIKADKGMGILGYYQLKVLDIITRSSATGRLGLPTAYGGSAADWRFMEDAAMVIRRMQLPTDEFPDGRMLIIANDQVLYEGKYPYGNRLNLYTYRWSVLPGSIFGFGMVRNLIMPQKRLNGLDTQDDLIRKTVGNPQWLTPKGLQFKMGQATAEPGHVHTFRFRPGTPIPHRMEGAAAPTYHETQRANIKDDMQEVSGIKHVLEGVAPQGITAGVSLELLVEQAGKRFQPTIDDNREEMKRQYMHRLEVAQEAPAWKYSERAVPIMGEDGERDVQKFMAADFAGNLTMDIEAVPLTAFSQTLKKQTVERLAGLGVIDLTSAQNREKLRSLEGVSDFDEPFSLDYKRAQMENEILEAGGVVEYTVGGKVQPTGPCDDDETHAQVHRRLIKSRRFSKLPQEIQQHVLDHHDAHMARLMPTTPEAETAPGQKPPAPAGPPGGGGPPGPDLGAGPTPPPESPAAGAPT